MPCSCTEEIGQLPTLVVVPQLLPPTNSHMLLVWIDNPEGRIDAQLPHKWLIFMISENNLGKKSVLKKEKYSYSIHYTKKLNVTNFILYNKCIKIKHYRSLNIGNCILAKEMFFLLFHYCKCSSFHCCK